jgi:hypothetical protein
MSTLAIIGLVLLYLIIGAAYAEFVISIVRGQVNKTMDDPKYNMVPADEKERICRASMKSPEQMRLPYTLLWPVTMVYTLVQIIVLLPSLIFKRGKS